MRKERTGDGTNFAKVSIILYIRSILENLKQFAMSKSYKKI